MDYSKGFFRLWVFLTFTCLIVNAASAQTMEVICSDLAGESVFYYDKNNTKKINTFITEKDAMSHSQMILTWDMSNTLAILQIEDSDPLFTEPILSSVEMTLLAKEKAQITFSGKDSSVMLSIYPLLGVGMYTQHSFLSFSNTSGSFATMLHCACRVKIYD